MPDTDRVDRNTWLWMVTTLYQPHHDYNMKHTIKRYMKAYLEILGDAHMYKSILYTHHVIFCAYTMYIHTIQIYNSYLTVFGVHEMHG